MASTSRTGGVGILIASVALAFLCGASASQQDSTRREELAADFSEPLVEGKVDGKPVYYFAPGDEQAERPPNHQVPPGRGAARSHFWEQHRTSQS